MSSNYEDHNFVCTHEGSSMADIVFIIDCTGSMGSYFFEVKKVITNLLAKWGSDTNKFAIVGYTDHQPDHGHLPAENPIIIFPSNRSLEAGDPSSVAQFMSTMITGGGGGRYGEALIDGLLGASTLNFRKDSNRLFILVCDDSPHGDEFLGNTTHPTGCPCGTNWRSLLQTIKAAKTDFIFVKLSELLNKTVDLFQGVYGGQMIIMPLNKVEEFEAKVTKTVITNIEKNFVFSKKLRDR